MNLISVHTKSDSVQFKGKYFEKKKDLAHNMIISGLCSVALVIAGL